jgi:hypothetical protein
MGRKKKQEVQPDRKIMERPIVIPAGTAYYELDGMVQIERCVGSERIGKEGNPIVVDKNVSISMSTEEMQQLIDATG